MKILVSAVAISATLLLGACSAFSTTPEPQLVSKVHHQIPLGLDLPEARSRLSDLGFSCEDRRGDYTAEDGSTRSDQQFVQCTRRPGTVSIACANRDQVVLKPTADSKVGAVEVTRGPHCSGQ